MQTEHHPDLSAFLSTRPAYAVALFQHFVDEYRQIGDVQIYPAKTMISIASHKKIAYVIQFGKAFLDVVFPFKQPYTDNLCFSKIKPVPGSDDYNHHLRIYLPDDVNYEVRMYMKMAYELGLR